MNTFRSITAVTWAFALLLFPLWMNAQQPERSLLDQLPDSNQQVVRVSQAFHSTRVIQSPSIEMLHRKNLDVRILHRFGQLDNGIKELFGLDEASMRMGLDYGITDHFMVGIGRSTYKKEYDLLLKFRPVQQSTGKKNYPVSVVLAGGAMVRTADEISLDGYEASTRDRTSYYLQLLAGRKFSNRVSFQVIQTFVHMSYVNDPLLEKNIYALGAAARVKLSPRLSLTLDYNHNFMKPADGYEDPLGIGLDIETGGHVFQLHFSNAVGMNERAYLTETTDEFFRGEIRFGFNLSRMFQLGNSPE